MVSSSNPENVVVFSGRVLLPLWSLLARMKISLDVVQLKGAFRICTDLLKTPHNLTKKLCLEH